MDTAADWILTGGAVETFVDGAPPAEALAVRSGRVLAVGSTTEAEALAGASTRRTDLAGATVFPGFTDTHMHLEKIARELAMVQLQDARDLDDLLGRFARAADVAGEDEWVRSFGDDDAWHERQLAERRLPTREELDRAVPRNPAVVYHREGLVLNSRAENLLAARLAALEPGLWDSELGLVRGPEVNRIESELPPPSRARELEQLAAGSEQLLRYGITTIVDPGRPAEFARAWELYRDARARGGLHQRLYLMNMLSYRKPFPEELARLEAGPIHPGDGDERLRAFAVKMILDGEFDNAWVRDDAASGTPAIRFAPTDLETVVRLCGARGWPLCVHTMGGCAIACVLDAVASAAADGAAFTRGQVSLAHVFLPSEEDVARSRELGVALSVHPTLAYVFEREMLEAWGRELADRVLPLATMKRLGAAIAGGSDTLPCAPLLGAHVAVTRRMRNGSVFGAAEALSPRDALALYTSGAAGYLRRDDLGTLAPSSVADLVVWPRNPLELDSEEWLALEPLLVAIDGRAVLGASAL